MPLHTNKDPQRRSPAFEAPRLLSSSRQPVLRSVPFAGSPALGLFLLLTFGLIVGGTIRSDAAGAVPAVLEIEGRVSVSRRGADAWDPAYTNQVLNPGDRIRTGERSRAVVRLSERTTVRMNEASILQVPAAPGKRSRFNLQRGFFYFFHRDKPGEIPIETPSAYAVIIGTEFHVAVAEDDTTRLQLIDGEVELTNAAGRLQLTSGEAATVAPGQKPEPTAVIEAANLVQWCLYYPAVLDLDELALTGAEQQALTESLAAYRQGDLVAALTNYPAGRQLASDHERVYLAALLLAVGQVGKAEAELDAVGGAAAPTGSRAATLGAALRRMILAVKSRGPLSQPSVAGTRETTGGATALLAESYVFQSGARLADALALARKATEVSPNSGFAWARVAELEFSFGRTETALKALERALELAPRHAEALALKGFLLSAQNEIHEAIRFFDQAIAIDGALGNAWLGRGLCRIRLGQSEAGREDLQVAATVEPRRAELRSYLAKAFSNVHDLDRAGREIELARQFDPNDPTAWLYSALLNQQRNRVNEAIRDLGRSQELNDNRAVYRAPLQLDQDRAMRGVNRAGVFDDAGMSDLSAREATRAVEADYANFSAHLFLGNSFQRLRDPNLISQRYETPAVTEYLMANLLSPVGAGTLAQTVSQHEYSKLFESDGLGVASTTEYLSNGDWLQSGVQYGTWRNTSYAFSGLYRSLEGWRPNNDLEQTELSLQIKHQITPRDSLYLRAIRNDIEAGDVLQRWDKTNANRTLQIEELQEPLLLAGYHHEWAPGVHTLMLGGWLNDEQKVGNGEQDVVIFQRTPVPQFLGTTAEHHYRNEVEFWTAELQQIWQQEPHGLVVGGRYQTGDLDTYSRQTNFNFIFPFLFPTNAQKFNTEFERWTAYAYYHVQVWEPLRLTAGLAYDSLKYPSNFRFAPIADGQETEDQLSPKGGLIWSVTKDTTLRAAYSQSLGGVGFDQSFRLEPTQVAGLNQAFRSIIPESIAGANAGATFETWGVLLEQKFGRGTYLAAGGEWLRSEVDRELGVFEFVEPFTIVRRQAREKLDYREQSLLVSLNQLLGNEWALGARYRLSQARLRSGLSDFGDVVAAASGPQSNPRLTEAVLHQVLLSANFSHPSGFFGRAESIWNMQSNQGYTPDRPGDDFWQFNVWAGYRWWQRRAEARVGVLNITDEDYRLNPLNLTPELPRERTVAISLRFVF